MDRFVHELGETNRRRLQVMLPVMALVHLVHVAVSWPWLKPGRGLDHVAPLRMPRGPRTRAAARRGW